MLRQRPSVRALAPCQVAVQDATSTLNALLLRTRGWKNRLAPVNRLSDELLASIFTSAASSDSDWPDAAGMAARLRLGAVCSRWRRASIAGPQLWTDMALPYNADAEACENLFARSQRLPVNVAISPRDKSRTTASADTTADGSGPPAVFAALHGQAGRLRSLSVVFRKADGNALAKLLAETAPQLARLHLVYDQHGGDEQRLVFYVFAAVTPTMPVLRSLSLVGIDATFFTSLEATGLRELEISNVHILRSSLAEFLSRNAELRSLRLERITFHHCTPIARWSVPKLDSLILRSMNPSWLAEVRRAINFSKIRQLELSLADYADNTWLWCMFAAMDEAHTVKIVREANEYIFEATSDAVHRRLADSYYHSQLSQRVEVLFLDYAILSRVHTLIVGPGTWNAVADVLQRLSPQAFSTLILDLSSLHDNRREFDAGSVTHDLKDALRHARRMACPAVTKFHVAATQRTCISRSSFDFALDLVDLGQAKLDRLVFVHVRILDEGFCADTYKHRAREIVLASR